jgi:hypothetical protein
VPRRRQAQVVRCPRERLADARARVVQEEQQRVVALPSRLVAVRLGKQYTHVLGLEVFDRVHGRTLGSHGQDALVLLRARQVVAQEVFDEASDGGKAAVPGRRHVAALHFDVVEECEHLVDDDIVEHKPANWSPDPLRHEQEEEAQRVAIGSDRVRAGAAGATQMMGKVRLNQSEQWIL